MKFTVKMWRQKNAQSEGHFESVEVKDISPDMSFLDMLDVVNEERIKKGEEPFAFDNDCREGICGTCSLVVNGQPHGANYGCTTCQLHMRMFTDGETITVEPFRSKAFPIVKDCVIDRSAFDRIIQAGGYVSVNTGSARSEVRCGPCLRGGGLHWLRRLRGGVPERVRDALHLREDRPSRVASAGEGRGGPARPRAGETDGQGRLRCLHERRRVCGGLPEGRRPRQHRPHEPPVPQGDDFR